MLVAKRKKRQSIFPFLYSPLHKRYTHTQRDNKQKGSLTNQPHQYQSKNQTAASIDWVFHNNKNIRRIFSCTSLHTMAEEKRPKKKGLFGRKKKKKDTESAGSRSVSTQGDASASTLDSALKSSGSSSGKKKGFGSRIKRMVGGRKRSSKKSKDDDSTGVSFMDPTDPNYKGPRTALDPDILAKVMEEEEYPTGSSGQKPFGGHPGGPGGGGLGRSPHSMARNMGHEEDEDEDVFDDRMSYGEEEDEYNSAENEPGDLNGPMSLVLLLVDPDTLRFELLQLEFETVQGAKVADVLDQIINSVTEPAIRTLEFHALVDRKGNPFSANTALPKAVTNRRRSKDILVGLSKGVTVEHCGRLARPILGDAKVIAMVRKRSVCFVFP